MTAASSQRNITKRLSTDALAVLKNFPVAAAAKIYSGTMVMLSAGYAVPAQVGLGLEIEGVADCADGFVDNTTGGNGALTVQVRAGLHGPFANSAGADAIAQANVGQDCYAVDDSTVALTDGNNTRSWAGRINAVVAGATTPYTPAGVMVEVGSRAAKHESNRLVLSMGVDYTTGLVNAQVLDFGAMPWGGRILAASLTTVVAATGAGATATVQLGTKIGAGGFVACTGGALVPTLANQNTPGKNLAASAITGANTFASGTNVQATVATVTAFTAGSGTLLVELG